MTRTATGTSASSSRLRALICACRSSAAALRPGGPAATADPGCLLPAVTAAWLVAVGQRPVGAGPTSLEVVEQRDRVVAASAARGRSRSRADRPAARRLDRDRVDLGVELDPERQVVRQPAVERHPAALVDAEEVDLADAEPGADADAGDDGGRRRAPWRRCASGCGAAAAAPARAPGAPVGRRPNPLARSGPPPRRSGRPGSRPRSRRPPRPPRGGRRRR